MQYLLPLKGAASGELADYLRVVNRSWPVIVVDGSEPDTFSRNAARFAGIEHLAPEFECANGKVAGVLTGFRRCVADTVVIADDDVRYEPAELLRLEALLATADLVVPQNYYRPLPLHARYDTARALINRALPSGDFPGTLALRLTPRLRDEGYDGDVLFENLQLIRTVRAHGGQVTIARDLFVRRTPPAVAQFVGQRVRQAYDSQAQPGRLAVELALLPVLVAARHRPGLLAYGAAGAIAVAELGRRRSGGARYFPATAALLAPFWVTERAVCAWLAIYRRLALGGTRYAGRRISRAAAPIARSRDCRRTAA